MTSVCRPPQGAHSIKRILYVDIGSVIQQDPHHFEVPLVCRVGQGSGAIAGLPFTSAPLASKAFTASASPFLPSDVVGFNDNGKQCGNHKQRISSRNYPASLKRTVHQPGLSEDVVKSNFSVV